MFRHCSRLGEAMTRRKRVPENIVIDVSSPGGSACIAKFHNVDRISKHDSSFQHIEACLDHYILALPCFSSDIPRRERSMRRVKCKHLTPQQKKKLDTEAFDCYWQNIWNNFSESKRTSIVYLDSFWFGLYMEASFKDKVLTWIKKKEIFTKKYVLVPVVCWSHWSLLILCNFGEELRSETSPPCMLLLDSLQMANPRRLEPFIRKFVSDIFKGNDKYDKDKAKISKIPLLVPKVPQQRNGEECGRFVLYYMNVFMESAPDTFSIKEFPYFLDKNWFRHEDVDNFFEKLGELRRLHVDRR